MSAAAPESSSHPLLRELRSVRSAARGVLLAHVTLRLVLMIVAVFVLAAAADYVFRPRSPGVRFALSGVVLAAGIAAVVRGRRLLSSFDGRDLPLARRLEALLPQPRPPLAAAVEFLTTPRVSSPQLRAAVIARCWDQVRSRGLRHVVDRGPLHPWLLAATTILLLAGVFVFARPDHAQAAWLRIAAPWETYRWPQRHLLQFIDPPERVAEGSAVRWTVVDRGAALPERVELEIRDEGESEVRRVLLPIDGERALGVTENVRRSFWYRARGGDDDSLPWKFVAVVPPPRLESWRVLMQAAGQTPRVVLPPLQIRSGVRLAIEGRVERGTTAVRVRSGDFMHTASIAATGEFHLPAEGDWSPTASGDWELEAIDASGVVGRQAIVRVELIPNQPPQIAWETPSDGEVIGDRGRVRIRGSAADDVRLRRVLLRSDDRELELPITPGERVSLIASVPAGALGAGELPRTLVFQLVAEDDEGGRTETPARRVTVVTSAELESRLTADFAEWTARLRELTQEQRNLRDEVSRGRGQAGRQRELARILAEPNAGLLKQIRRGLSAWVENQLPERALIATWQTAVERLQTLAVRDMEGAAAAIEAAPRSAETSELQEQVVADLEKILRDVTAESQSVDLERAFTQLGRRQQELLSATQAWLLQSLTTKADPTELRPLQTSQNELAREADRLQQAVTADAGLAAVAEIVRRQALGAKMREAAAALEANVEAATALQEQIAAGIEEILQAFRGEASDESAADAERRLRELTDWVRRQSAALDVWRAKLDDGAAAFATAETELAAELERAIRAGNFAGDQGVQRQLAAAEEQLRDAAGAAATATPRAALTRGIAAEASLQDARRALVAAIDALRQQAARQEAARLAEETRAFIARQERIAERTARLGREDVTSRVADAELVTTAGEQIRLADELRAAAAEKSPLYRLVLLESARAAAYAARRLDGRDAGVETLRLQQETLTVLRQLLRALEEDTAENGGVEDDRPRPPSPEEDRPAAARSAAELRLVLERQQAVLKATTNAARRLTANLPDRLSAATDLARQQGGLAELAESWARERGDRVAPAPDALAESITDEQWRQRVAAALVEGEDLGAEKLTAFTRLAMLMRAAEVGLAGGKLSEPIERLQRTVINDLEALVAAAGKKGKGSQNKSTAGQGSQQPETGGGDPMNTAASDSTGRKPAATAPIFDPRALERQLGGVWGNLPEKVREDLRQTSAEEFLPEYERLIIDYYRRLAEEPREAP